jgi:hypothetical protein
MMTKKKEMAFAVPEGLAKARVGVDGSLDGQKLEPILSALPVPE